MTTHFSRACRVEWARNVVRTGPIRLIPGSRDAGAARKEIEESRTEAGGLRASTCATARTVVDFLVVGVLDPAEVQFACDPVLRLRRLLRLRPAYSAIFGSWLLPRHENACHLRLPAALFSTVAVKVWRRPLEISTPAAR